MECARSRVRAFLWATQVMTREVLPLVGFWGLQIKVGRMMRLLMIIMPRQVDEPERLAAEQLIQVRTRNAICIGCQRRGRRRPVGESVRSSVQY